MLLRCQCSSRMMIYWGELRLIWIKLKALKVSQSLLVVSIYTCIFSFSFYIFEIEKCLFVVQIQAGTTFVGQDEIIFLKETQTLWTPTAESGSKLKGKHSWPFKFALKCEIPMKEEKKDEMIYRLPPNFTERASPAYIDYKLIVTVHRGMLRVNQVCAFSLGSRILSKRN